MKAIISETRQELGMVAAQRGAAYIRKAVHERGKANIIMATGSSQLELLGGLVKEEIDWSVVTAFQLDEYIGISDKHPASLCKYFKERFVDLVVPKEFTYINGNTDPGEECMRLKELISRQPIDVAFVGIGENGRLAFNEPPADFDTEEPYIVVSLSDECRRQQLGDGWFPTFEEVPGKAISMSVKQIMKSKVIICCVPDDRKSQAVYDTLNCEIIPEYPSSIMRNHPDTTLFLDKESSSLI
jgi:glucosamine-6-phosphate deaminase